MAAFEKLVESDEIAQRFAHLLSGDGNHVVVHPVAHRSLAVCRHRLCDFRLMVRELQVETAAVDIELLAKVFATHCGAFHVPSREAVAPR